MSVYANCTIACTATPECTVCGKTKKLAGRDYPAANGGAYCDHGCEGYRTDPQAGHVWPSEWADHAAGDHSGCMHG